MQGRISQYQVHIWRRVYSNEISFHLRICIQHGIIRCISNLAWTSVQIELKKALAPALVSNRAHIWRHYVRVTVPDRGSEEGNRNWLCWCMKCLQSGRKLQESSFLAASPIFRVICFRLLTSNPHPVDFFRRRYMPETRNFLPTHQLLATFFCFLYFWGSHQASKLDLVFCFFRTIPGGTAVSDTLV
jgi:hypothetical protein